MKSDAICREILTTTAGAVGGVEALATLLQREPKDVEAWVQGMRLAPMNVYFGACLLLLHRPKDANSLSESPFKQTMTAGSNQTESDVFSG